MDYSGQGAEVEAASSGRANSFHSRGRCKIQMTEARRPLDHVETCGKWHNRRASEVAKQKKIVAHVLLPSLPPTPILQHPLRDAVVPFYFNANAVCIR